MYTGSFGSASNRARWSFTLTLTDADNNNAAVDLTGATVEVAIADKSSPSTLLEASTSDGKVTIASPATGGSFTVTFPRSDMEQLEAGHYDVGIVVTISSVPYQLAMGNLAVLHGVVGRTS